MDASATFLIERKSSIENEPRTLNMDQLQFAREAAFYVAQTRSIEEALDIFTKGLEPVVSGVKDEESFPMDSTEEYCDSFPITQWGLQTAAVPVTRDIASAPF
ncbi:uncharacterized protein LOC122072741 [Macadamia integrifolia]|uniref:uncharacterized protein LOC122072741 n=1 Tax=Macadamia integrifolia TaxID=60698 RepID=UPI001C4FD185|nr:uncharacterized protein LOC122072741 [Macadamia integrifolia]